MGKRKIGEIYNKPIVEGDKNLVTNNEIHKSELSEGGAYSGEDAMEYFDLSSERIAECPLLNSVALFCTKLKLATSDGEPTAIMDYSGLSVMSMQMANYKIIGGGVDFNTITITKQNGEIIKSTYFEAFLQTIAQGGYTIEDYNNIPRITKEEFYSLN